MLEVEMMNVSALSHRITRAGEGEGERGEGGERGEVTTYFMSAGTSNNPRLLTNRVSNARLLVEVTTLFKRTARIRGEEISIFFCFPSVSLRETAPRPMRFNWIGSASSYKIASVVESKFFTRKSE
jgi:hypothetical protein